MSHLTLDKRLIIINPDGTFSTTTFFRDGMLAGETEDDFITRQTEAVLSSIPSLVSKPQFLKTKNEIEAAVLLHPEGKKRSLRMDNKGQFSHDMTYKEPKEILAENKISIREKLKSGEALLDTEIDTLIGKISQ